MGYCRPRGVWKVEAACLSRHRCLFDCLFGHRAFFFHQCSQKGKNYQHSVVPVNRGRCARGNQDLRGQQDRPQGKCGQERKRSKISPNSSLDSQSPDRELDAMQVPRMQCFDQIGLEGGLLVVSAGSHSKEARHPRGEIHAKGRRVKLQVSIDLTPFTSYKQLSNNNGQYRLQKSLLVLQVAV